MALKFKYNLVRLAPFPENGVLGARNAGLSAAAYDSAFNMPSSDVTFAPLSGSPEAGRGQTYKRGFADGSRSASCLSQDDADLASLM